MAAGSASKGTLTTRPRRPWSPFTTAPLGTVTPASASRRAAFGPDPCSMPIWWPLPPRPATNVAIGTAGPRPEKIRVMPDGTGGMSSSSTWGRRLTQPRPPAARARIVSSRSCGADCWIVT